MNIKRLLLVLTLMSGMALAGDRPAPMSWSLDRDATADLAAIALERFGALDLEALALDDGDREAMGEPPRFAWPHATSLSVERHGNWDHHADTGIWRIRVHAENANLINFGFANVQLPPGSQLFIYSPKAALDRQMDRYLVIGPYDHSINRENGEFWTPNLQGDEAIVEINVPSASRAQLSFEITQVSHGYRGFGEAALGYRQSSDRAEGDGKQICRDEGGVRSGACNQDVACLSENDPWNDPRQAVGAYQRSGSFACTGSLVNNTAQDQRMLFITATHCISQAQAPSIVVYWNYEWPTCRRPGATGGTSTNPPDPNMSNSGGTWLAATVNPFGGGGCTNGSQCSDVTLVELTQPANPDFNLFWAGWDRRPPPTVCAQGPGNSTAGLCATIHHPGVDEKRITWVEQNIQVGNIASATGVHWHPFWHPNPPELPNMPPPPPSTIPPAVTEGGSSGSPLYSADRRLLGVLSGGPAFCGATGSSLSDFYGGLFHAWDGLGTPTSRMRDYLDPLDTAPLFIDGTGRDGFSLRPDPAEVSQCGSADIVIDIEVGQLGEFNDPVTLATSGLPGGVSDDFSVNPVIPPGSSLLTLSNLAAAGSGPFSFSLEGNAGEFDQSVNISVFLANDSPQPASISSPANGAIGVSTTPTIIWSSDLGVSFELEIATDPAFDNVVYSVSLSETSHQVSNALNSSTVHYTRVRAANDCGTGDWSQTIGFTTAALPGDCPVGTVDSDLLFENFNGGNLPTGWSTAGSSGGVTWVPTTAQSHSGSYSIFSQNLATVSDQRLATPVISLPNNAVSLFMNWQNWQEIEAGGGTGCYDGGLLEISTNGGANWTPVDDAITVRDYDGTINSSFSNPLAGLPAWCGDPRAFWERYTVSLADWAGQDVQLRFRFGTDSSVSRVGWYVDSVNVRACFPAGSSYNLGGTVSGLAGSGLVLQNIGGSNLAISENGSFEFATALFDGQAYHVSVAVEPSAPAQVCQIINGSGTVDGEDVTDVEVVCELAEFSIGGTVSGLSGSGLVLQNNGGDDLAILANGSFEFATELTDGESYDVTVANQPGTPAQTCNVNNASGTVNAADVNDIVVVCEDRVTTLTGLISSLGYCQDEPSALGGALVAVNGQNQAYSMATGGNGLYQFELPADESPISITVSQSNHRNASLSGLELDEKLIEQDFGLVLRAACARTDQESLGFSLVSGSQSQQELVLSNALGGIDLTWSLDTGPGCYAPGEPDWLGLSHTGGLIAWGNQRVITLSVDTAGLADGQYGTSLCIATSDPNNPSIEVEVMLGVFDPLIFRDRFKAPPEN